MVLASGLDLTGSSTALMVSLTKAVGGDDYLSGPTGPHVPEPERFAEAGLGLRYHEFAAFEYPQLHGAFVPGLSCLDYIANCGFTPWKSRLGGGLDERRVPLLLPHRAQHFVVVPEHAEGAAEPSASPGDLQNGRVGGIGVGAPCVRTA